MAFNNKGFTEFYAYIWNFEEKGVIKLNVSIYEALSRIGVECDIKTVVKIPAIKRVHES